MIWAAFTLAFFAFLRCSEFTYPGARNFSSQFNLTTDSVTFSPSLARPQHMLLKLKLSKTDSFRQGQSLMVTRCSSLLCPVSAMQRYFMLAQPRPGPLFYFQSGLLLTRSSVTHFTSGFCSLCGTPVRESKRSQSSYRRRVRCVRCGRCGLTRLVNKSFRLLVLGLLSTVYSHSRNSLAFCCSQYGSCVKELYLVFCCCLGGCIASSVAVKSALRLPLSF